MILLGVSAELFLWMEVMSTVDMVEKKRTLNSSRRIINVEITNDDLNLVQSIANKYKGVDAKDSFLDELVGEGCVGLAKAAASWNPEIASESTYKYTCIDNAMKDYLRKNTRNNNEINLEEGVDACYDENLLTPEENMIYKEELDEAKQRVLEIVSTLTTREQHVLFNHILSDEPETMRSMAEQYGCSKDAILRDCKRVKDMLKARQDEG
jgi:RNA polymerase sigma factor (sigma-70 family)